MREPDFAGLRAVAEDAVRQPDFGTVRQRAGRVRRRRAATTGAVLAAVLVASGLGYAARGGPAGPPDVAAPTPPPSSRSGWPRLAAAVSAAADEVYALVDRCRGCEPDLFGSADGGRHWERRTVPPRPAAEPDRLPVSLTAVGPGTLAWRDSRLVRLVVDGTGGARLPTEEEAGPPAPTWITVDGGRTWRMAAVATEPAEALAPGTRPLDCRLLDRPGPCLVYAVDPGTGAVAPLAGQPTGVTIEPGWTERVDAPADGRPWVAGLDPVTLKPAVATSADRGRTWRTHVFTRAAPAVEDDDGSVATRYLPLVAAGPGGEAYALLHRVGKVDGYHTTDGGATWSRVPTTGLVEAPYPGYVAADGAHVVILPTDTGVRFLASRDAGYAPVAVTGYPRDAVAPSLEPRRVADRFFLEWNEGLHVSRDGWAWRAVPLP